MPVYKSRCQGCEATHDIRLSFQEYDGVKSGVKVLECATCHGQVMIEFNPGDVTFVLHDGESGGWQSKCIKENRYRAIRQRIMERRQRDHAPQTKLIPNFAGELAPSWKDAQEAAREVAYEETRDPVAASEAAATYDPLVRSEVSR